ncbi:MAG: hypothetical protein RBJ76_05175 [Stenomitos frigidus ULC029]
MSKGFDSSLILHPSSFIPHSSSFILHPSSFILYPSSLCYLAIYWTLNWQRVADRNALKPYTTPV